MFRITKLKVEYSFLFRFLHSYYQTHLAKVYSQRNSFYDSILREKNSDDANDNILTKHVVLQGEFSLIKYWKSQPTRRGNETL